MQGDADKPRRRRVNGEASQQKILEAATEIAAERGYEGTSIGLVSERSGLPASSIYWHFKDKDALLAAVIEHSFAKWLANAEPAEPLGGGSVERQLVTMTQRTAKALLESPDFLRLGLMLTLERRAVEPTARRRFLAVREEALANTIATFSHLFPDLDDSALRQLGTFSMAVADGLFIAGEIDSDAHDMLAGFDLLATAIHAAARRLASVGVDSDRVLP